MQLDSFNPHLPLNAHVNNVVGNHRQSIHSPGRWAKAGLHQVKIIASELNELILGHKAYTDQPLSEAELAKVKKKAGEDLRTWGLREVRDGVGDVIVTTDGAYHRLDLPTSNGQMLRVAGMHVSMTFGLGQSQVEVVNNLLTNAGGHLESIKLILQQVQDGWDAAVADDNESGGDIVYDVLPGTENLLRAMLDDIQLAMYAVSTSYHINLVEDQVLIYRSNMSKFDTDSSVAAQGVQAYADQGVQTYISEQQVGNDTYYIIKSAADQEVGGKDFPKDKFLKSVNFAEPDFSNMGGIGLRGFVSNDVLAEPSIGV